ncbi:MAG: MFS transporter [Chlamydiia bacterium]|nr:MFS transporter [Chlamydiia bacterium]
MTTYSALIRLILAPLLAIVFVMLGNGFFMTFVSLRIVHDGGSEWLVGAVHSAYYLGMLIGAAKAETVINRVGHIRAYAAFAGLGTSCLLLLGLWSSPILWIVIRGVIGYCIAVYYVVVESWFLHSATERTRGVILALYMMTLYLSQATSQFFLELVDIEAATAFLIGGCFCAFSAVPLALTRAPSPHLNPLAGHSLGALLRQSPFGFIGCVISGMVLSSFSSFAPLFAEEHALPVSLTMSCCIMGGVILQWPIGRLSDIFDRRRVLFGVTLGLAFVSWLMIALAPTQAGVYSTLFILGGLAFTLYPLSITEVCDRLQPSEITRATGMLLLAYGIGAVVGPLLAPIPIDMSPRDGLFMFLLANGIALGAVGTWSLLVRPPVAEELQGEYVPLPRQTPVAYELDPRSETPLPRADADA